MADESLGSRWGSVLQLILIASVAAAATVGLYGAWLAAEPPVEAVDVELSTAVASTPAAAHDELLASPMLQDEDFLREVGQWVHFWQTKPSRWFPSYLERMTWFEVTVDSVLAAHELPWSLRYLPIIESGYSPTAVSRARAAGVWQFMAPTARELGLEVGEHVDERRDPYRATEAAADFLVELRRDFGSWFLALAAYNAGPDRIRGILRQHAPGASPSDSVYWAVRRHLPKETRDFVPNLFGAMIVAYDPSAHGYDLPVPSPFAYDSVLVASNTTLDGVARAAGTTRAEMERLNPHYVRGVTPPGRPAWVRIPVGSGDALRASVTEAQEGSGSGG